MNRIPLAPLVKFVTLTVVVALAMTGTSCVRGQWSSIRRMFRSTAGIRRRRRTGSSPRSGGAPGRARTAPSTSTWPRSAFVERLMLRALLPDGRRVSVMNRDVRAQMLPQFVL